MEAQQEQNNETNTTLLTYAVNTLPNPVEVTEQVNLELVVSNTRPNEVVYLKDIGIQLLPTDPSLPVLTDDPSKFSCTVTPAGIWGITNQGGVVTLTSQSGKSQAITTDAISIQLNGATVNAQIGTCYINIAEITTDANGNALTRRIPAPGIPIAKFPNGFSLSNFTAIPSTVRSGHDSQVKLTWQVNRVPGCTLHLAWGEKSLDVTNTNEYTVLASDMSHFGATHFTLRAVVDGVTFQKQTESTLMIPNIISVTNKPDILYSGSSATLTWYTQCIGHCDLVTSAGTVIVDNIMPDEHGLCSCSISPQHTITFHVQAYDTQGHLSVQSTPFQVCVYKKELGPMDTVIIDGNNYDNIPTICYKNQHLYVSTSDFKIHRVQIYDCLAKQWNVSNAPPTFTFDNSVGVNGLLVTQDSLYAFASTRDCLTHGIWRIPRNSDGSLSDNMFQLKPLVTIVPDKSQKKYHSSEGARLIDDVIYYRCKVSTDSSQVYCFAWNINWAREVSESQYAPDQLPPGIDAIFNQKEIETNAAIYSVIEGTSSWARLFASYYHDVLIAETSITAQLSTSPFTQFSTNIPATNEHDTAPHRTPLEHTGCAPLPSNCCTIV